MCTLTKMWIVLKNIGTVGGIAAIISLCIMIYDRLPKSPTVKIRSVPQVNVKKLAEGYEYDLRIEILRFDSRKEGQFGIDHVALETNAGNYERPSGNSWGNEKINEQNFRYVFTSTKLVAELKGTIIFTSIFGDKMKAKFKVKVTDI